MPLRINYPTQLVTTVGQQVRIALPALNSRTIDEYNVVMAADAAIGAELITVDPLPTAIYAGETLEFGPSSLVAVVTDTVDEGQTSIPVRPLDAVIADNLTARTFATVFVAGATDASPSSQPKTTDATNYNSGAGSEMAVIGTSRTLSFSFNRIEGDVGGDALMQVLYNDAYYNREIFAFVERTNGEIYSGAAIATTGTQQAPVQEKVTMNVNLQFQGESFRFKPSLLSISSGPEIPWLPTLEPSLRLWIDPSDTTGWTLDGSGNPTAMRSKAVTQDIFTLETGTSPVLSGGALVVNSGTTRFTNPSVLGLTADPALSIAFSGVRTGTSALTLLSFGSGTGSVSLTASSNFNSFTYNGLGNTSFSAPTNPVAGSVDAFVRSPGTNRSTSRHRENGTESTITGSVDGATTVSGSTTLFTTAWLGTLDELLAFSSIDQTLIERTEGYLAHKHGRTAQLPANHPFKFSPPMVPVFSQQ